MRRTSQLLCLRAAFLSVTFFAVFAPHASAAGAGAADPSVSPMRSVIDRYETDRRSLSRHYTSDETSPAYRERLGRLYDERLRDLGGVNFDALDRPGKIDYLLLRNDLTFRPKQLRHEQKEVEQAGALLPFAGLVIGLEDARRAGPDVDAAQCAKTLAELTRQVAASREALEQKLKAGDAAKKELPGPVLANRAAKFADQLRDTLKRWHGFYSGYDPEFSWWMREPYPKADKALEEYAGFLRKKLAGFPEKEGEDEPVIGDPVGREALLDALENEFIPYTPEQLIEIANAEFKWCEAEMKKAADDLGCAGDWKKALDLVSNKHVRPGEQPKLIKQLAEEATKFVEDRQLVTVPELCKQTWRIEMMPPDRQKVNPYFTGGAVISVSFPTDAMTYDDKQMSMRGNNPSFCRATVHHELIPGHHLQIFMGDRYNTHRRAFATPFLIEGWPLYWEMLLWDQGFARSAEDRVGMLFWRAHRCARIIFSLKFHLGQMTPQQAIDLLVDRVGHERRNATAEVRRSVSGDYEPLYQAAYLLGGLQIRAMRKERVDSKKMTDRQFHDAILRENAIPVALIRASLTGQELTRDFKSDWRFYPQPSQPAAEAPALAPAPYEPTTDYARQTIEGWPIYLSKQLQGDGKEAAGPALTLLRVQLYEITRVVPAPALAKLRRVPIWVEREDRGFPCMCYHPSPDWLREHGYNPDKAGGVELASVANFLTWTKDQPWMVLHELAHAYHHKVLGYDHAAVRKAYEAAKSSGRYDSVLHINGQSRRHYALNNDQEYFAEATEAYFGTNDFFPFVRSELEKHDPGMFRVLGEVWGGRDSR